MNLINPNIQRPQHVCTVGTLRLGNGLRVVHSFAGGMSQNQGWILCVNPSLISQQQNTDNTVQYSHHAGDEISVFSVLIFPNLVFKMSKTRNTSALYIFLLLKKTFPVSSFLIIFLFNIPFIGYKKYPQRMQPRKAESEDAPRYIKLVCVGG